MVKRTRGGKLQLRSPRRSGNKLLPRYKQAARLQLDYVDPLILVPDPDNARVHPDKQLVKLDASLKRFEFNDPIEANPITKKVISGHARLEAALRAGLEKVPVIWISHLSPKEERAYQQLRFG